MASIEALFDFEPENRERAMSRRKALAYLAVIAVSGILTAQSCENGTYDPDKNLPSHVPRRPQPPRPDPWLES